LPIESAVRLQHCGAKGVNNLGPGLAVGFDNLARQDIRVDDRGALALENFRNRAFPRGDAAG